MKEAHQTEKEEKRGRLCTTTWSVNLERGELWSDKKTMDEGGRLSGTYPAGAASDPDPPLRAAQPPYPVGSFRVGLGPHRFRAGTPGCGQAVSSQNLCSQRVVLEIPLKQRFIKSASSSIHNITTRGSVC